MDLKEFIKNMEEVVEGYDVFLESFLTKEGIKIINEAKKRTPVDTGALRSSWSQETGDIKNLEIKIINNQNYASFIEYGTEKIKKKGGYKMLTTPVEKYIFNVEKDFKNAFGKYLKNKGLV